MTSNDGPPGARSSPGGRLMAEATLRIQAAGAGVTLQDAGRHGYLRYGITPAGPMDPLAFASANRVLENPPGATAIESRSAA